jgi:poly(3-hydroxybutyrate) depolymerase
MSAPGAPPIQAGGGGAAATPGSGGQYPDSGEAIEALKAYLAAPRSGRAELASQPFAMLALGKADAETARVLLWDDFAGGVRESRASEVGATETVERSVEVDGHSMRYYMAVRGEEPPSGRSLFISMHGGGDATSDLNDSQWENQIALVEGYDPRDAIWVAPRAPSDAWNMWFTDEIDALFERLITDMIVFEGIDPDKVYIGGYSAGGDGVYQLGPRMADHFAGAAMSAGHPNTASPLNLRNLPFAIHVGAEDTAFDRNLKAEEWGHMLEALAMADPGGYPNQWQVHAGKPHWMDMDDAVSVPFMQGFTRDPMPAKVVWRQAELTRPRMYWLAVDEADAMPGALIRASHAGNSVTIGEASNVLRLHVRLADAMMNLDEPVRIEQAGRELFAGMAPRTIAVIARTLQERGDPSLIYSAELTVQLR